MEGFKFEERFFAVVGEDDAVALLFEVEAEQFADILIVIGDKDFSQCHSHQTSFLLSESICPAGSPARFVNWYFHYIMFIFEKIAEM